MKTLTLAEVAAAVGGQLAGGAPDAVVTGATADSREVTAGDLFVAIVGDRVDGHQRSLHQHPKMQANPIES